MDPVSAQACAQMVSPVALVYMMEAVGADVNDATVKKWADALEQKESLVQKDMELYKQNKDKIEQGMQMVKALEIREKELRFFVERYTNLATQASVVAGFAFDGRRRRRTPRPRRARRSAPSRRCATPPPSRRSRCRPSRARRTTAASSSPAAAHRSRGAARGPSWSGWAPASDSPPRSRRSDSVVSRSLIVFRCFIRCDGLKGTHSNT